MKLQSEKIHLETLEIKTAKLVEACVRFDTSVFWGARAGTKNVGLEIVLFEHWSLLKRPKRVRRRDS